MPLQPEALTWTGLLSQWIQFAQAALALRQENDGDRWRASVASIINLQAVTFALADLDRLPQQEHAVAVDKAELLINASVKSLQTAWDAGAIPDSVREMIDDAQLALRSRRAQRH